MCSISPRAAREHVRVARALANLPLLHAAFARGELSYSKMRAGRMDLPDCVDHMLQIAPPVGAAPGI